jgi:TatD DNase family protein
MTVSLRPAFFLERVGILWEMMKMSTPLGPWIDTHSHIADPRLDQSREQIMAEAKDRGIGFFLQGGVGPEDWNRQMELAKTYPLGLCFGVHPYFVASHEDEECEQALDYLATLIHKAMALGELGLDFRPHIMKESRERQISVFEDQLAIAETAHKPLVLHIVQAHEDALKVFRMWGVPKRKGIVHSFNGSWNKAQDFLNLGLALSVGGPLVRSDNQKLKQTVKECPLEFLLLETDSPDQPPEALKGQLNSPSTLWMVAEEVARLKGMTAHEILDISTSNFRRIFGNTNTTAATT